MLVNFEHITEDLTQYETERVLPLIVVGLSTKLGKASAITGTEICRKVNASGKLANYKLTSVKLRKIISCIRISGRIRGLCSTSKGYFRANTKDELESCSESLRQRLRQQSLTLNALESQMAEMFNTNNHTNG